MHLIDCFMEIITYTSGFLQTVKGKEPRFEDVKNDYASLFRRADVYLKENKYSAKECDLARFAVCAWVDESILCSSWKERGLWEREQLQRTYFKTTNSGEEFFDRLDSLAPEEKGIREVYAYCLALGFSGRYYKLKDKPELDNIKSANLKYVLNKSSLDISVQDTAANLFPGAYKAGLTDTKSRGFRGAFSFFSLAFIVWPPVLFGVLFFLYQNILTRFVANFFGKAF